MAGSTMTFIQKYQSTTAGPVQTGPQPFTMPVVIGTDAYHQRSYELLLDYFNSQYEIFSKYHMEVTTEALDLMQKKSLSPPQVVPGDVLAKCQTLMQTHLKKMLECKEFINQIRYRIRNLHPRLRLQGEMQSLKTENELLCSDMIRAWELQYERWVKARELPQRAADKFVEFEQVGEQIRQSDLTLASSSISSSSPLSSSSIDSGSVEFSFNSSDSSSGSSSSSSSSSSSCSESSTCSNSSYSSSSSSVSSIPSALLTKSFKTSFMRSTDYNHQQGVKLLHEYFLAQFPYFSEYLADINRELETNETGLRERCVEIHRIHVQKSAEINAFVQSLMHHIYLLPINRSINDQPYQHINLYLDEIQELECQSQRHETAQTWGVQANALEKQFADISARLTGLDFLPPSTTSSSPESASSMSSSSSGSSDSPQPPLSSEVSTAGKENQLV